MTCPAQLGRCVKCKPCNIMSGWAGAGAFDGKLSQCEEGQPHRLPQRGGDRALIDTPTAFTWPMVPPESVRIERPQGGRSNTNVSL